MRAPILGRVTDVLGAVLCLWFAYRSRADPGWMAAWLAWGVASAVSCAFDGTGRLFRLVCAPLKHARALVLIGALNRRV